jgi:hypothetical protein
MRRMASDFSAVFTTLKPILAEKADGLQVKADTPTEYTVLTKSPSPFPQHKGEPLYFGSVRLGKAYVSFHLMPLCPELSAKIPPRLKKKMQGKTCFNFKKEPEADVMAELRSLTDESFRFWAAKKWL